MNNQIRRLAGFGTAEIMTTPVNELTYESQADLWQALDIMEQAIKKRKAELRLGLIKSTQAQGQTTKSGAKCEVSGASVSYSLSHRRKFNSDAIMAALPSLGLTPEALGKVSLKVDTKKFDQLETLNPHAHQVLSQFVTKTPQETLRVKKSDTFKEIEEFTK